MISNEKKEALSQLAIDCLQKRLSDRYGYRNYTTGEFIEEFEAGVEKIFNSVEKL